jgi:cytochrome c biogenesis factor
LIHLGFVCLAVGVTGSSLGTHQQKVVMSEGQTLRWAGRRIRCARLIERELPDKLVAEAELEVSREGSPAVTLLPAQHLHRAQNQWTTEVAIDSTWRGDLYVILHGSEGDGRVRMTLIENPLVRWMWCGGWIAGAGILIGLWRARRPAPRQSGKKGSGLICA